MSRPPLRPSAASGGFRSRARTGIAVVVAAAVLGGLAAAFGAFGGGDPPTAASRRPAPTAPNRPASRAPGNPATFPTNPSATTGSTSAGRPTGTTRPAPEGVTGTDPSIPPPTRLRVDVLPGCAGNPAASCTVQGSFTDSATDETGFRIVLTSSGVEVPIDLPPNVGTGTVIVPVPFPVPQGVPACVDVTTMRGTEASTPAHLCGQILDGAFVTS